MFEDRKIYKKMESLYNEAMQGELPAIRDHVISDTNEVVVPGQETILGDDPILITGPAGVESGEWAVTDWGWLVLTNKRLNFQRIDGDRVRVAFVNDIKIDSTDGPFYTCNWQDRASLRRISFGFLKKNNLRDELKSRIG